MIVFLDASAVIYLVEGQAVWAKAVKQQLRQLAATAHASGDALLLAVGRLSWLECRVAALERYEGFFSRPDPHGVEITAAVVEQATLPWADHHPRTPDALQVSCCLWLGSTAVMVTGAAAFQRVPGLVVAQVQGGDPAAA